MRIVAIITICIAGLVAGCSGAKGPSDVVKVYYSSAADGDFDTFQSCLSPVAQQELLAEFADEKQARVSFGKLSDAARKLEESARVTKVSTHGANAMVWIAEGDALPEDGKVYSLAKQDDRWVITKQQLLVSFYKNGSRLDWEKTQSKSHEDTSQ